MQIPVEDIQPGDIVDWIDGQFTAASVTTHATYVKAWSTHGHWYTAYLGHIVTVTRTDTSQDGDQQ